LCDELQALVIERFDDYKKEFEARWGAE